MISDGPHSFLMDRLRRGELDLVIGRLGATDTMKGISFTQLYNEHVVIVVRPGHPLCEQPDVTRLAEWPVLFPSEASAIRPLVEAFHDCKWFRRDAQSDRNSIRCLLAGPLLPKVMPSGSSLPGSWPMRSRMVGWFNCPSTWIRPEGLSGLMVRQDSEAGPAERMFRLAVDQTITALGMD